MSYRVPNRMPSQRASSFHIKKIATPLQNFCEDTDQILSRYKVSTPNRIKSNRISSFVDINNTPKSSSKGHIHQHIFDTPKSKILEKRNLSIVDPRLANLNEIHDMSFPLSKPQIPKLGEEFRKAEEKYLIRILELTKENELLKVKLEKVSNRKNSDFKHLKTFPGSFKHVIEEFVERVREEMEKLFCFLPDAIKKPEVYQVFESFNSHLNILLPWFGLDSIKKHSFNLADLEMSQNTGRFKSLSDTQHSFTSASSQMAPLKEVIALSNFHASHHGELSFNVGDRIQLIKTDDPFCWLGKLGDKVGRIPAQLVMLD